MFWDELLHVFSLASGRLSVLRVPHSAVALKAKTTDTSGLFSDLSEPETHCKPPYKCVSRAELDVAIYTSTEKMAA